MLKAGSTIIALPLMITGLPAIVDDQAGARLTTNAGRFVYAFDWQ